MHGRRSGRCGLLIANAARQVLHAHRPVVSAVIDHRDLLGSEHFLAAEEAFEFFDGFVVTRHRPSGSRTRGLAWVRFLVCTLWLLAAPLGLRLRHLRPGSASGLRAYAVDRTPSWFWLA